MLKEQPSFYWRRNMACSFEEDANAKGHILEAVGVDNVLWATDYPHPDSTWPHSQEVVSNLFGGLSDVDRAKIAGGNAETAVQTGGAGGGLAAVTPVSLRRCGRSRCGPTPWGPSPAPS